MSAFPLPPGPDGVQSTGSGCIVAGAFAWEPAVQNLEWSPEVYDIYGFIPGEVVPTVDLFLAHEHPDDRPAAMALIARLTQVPGPFTLYHRIFDVRSKTRQVLTVGEADAGNRSGLKVFGYHMDLTEFLRRETNRIAREGIAAFKEHAALIEQAKGILMATQGISAEEAFTILSRRSQEQNRKVRDIAAGIVTGVQVGNRSGMETEAGASANF